VSLPLAPLRCPFFPPVETLRLPLGIPMPSNALASASIAPRPVLWAYSYVGPLMARFTPMSNLPAWYAEIPVYIGANPSGRGKGLEASNERLKPLGWPKWAEGTTGKTVWDKLERMIHES
jgi:hypothetical protein